MSARAAELLIDQAWAAYAENRYQDAALAASGAVEVAGQLDDPVLLVRALRVEASALRLMGDQAMALARYTRILGMANDPACRDRLDDPSAAEAIGVAYWTWVRCARSLTGIPVRELYQVLDAAERWLAATGHAGWRANVVYERAYTHKMLGERQAAVAAAEEALAVALQYPDAPGYALSGFRFGLGDILCDARRPADAAPHYQAVLDDPTASDWDRHAAHEGLARCALAAGDLAAARQQASAVTQLGESLGNGALCTSLDALAEVCRADGDLDDAWQAATRYLAAAGRIGGHYQPYFAVRMAVDIALDRGDLVTAQRLLADLDQHAQALDTSTVTTTWTSETVQRRQRLTELAAPQP
ncbi:MAG: hypothetical protein ABJB47_11100 [Actinomycetota bacterium]